MSMSEIAPRSTRAGLQERAEHCHSAFQSRSLAPSPWRPRSEVSPRCCLRRRLEKLKCSTICIVPSFNCIRLRENAVYPFGRAAIASNCFHVMCTVRLFPSLEISKCQGADQRGIFRSQLLRRNRITERVALPV